MDAATKTNQETTMTSQTMTPECLKTWKVRTSIRGVVLTINGREYELGATAASLAFEVDRAARGWNAPEMEHTLRDVEFG